MRDKRNAREFWSKNLKGRSDLKYLGLDERKILEKFVRRCALH